MQQALREAAIKSPDWKKIGKQLGVQLRGCITASILIEGWQAHGSEMSWERLAQTLEKIPGNEYELAAGKARRKRGMCFSR